MRWAIDIIIVMSGRKIVRCGESGRGDTGRAAFRLVSAIPMLRPETYPSNDRRQGHLLHGRLSRLKGLDMDQKPSAHAIDITENAKRVRVRFNGRVVADTQQARTLREGNLPPVQYVPR